MSSAIDTQLNSVLDRLVGLAEQHKKILLQNAELNHKLRAAELAHGATLWQVAHEIKKPLTLMRGLLDKFIQTRTPADCCEKIDEQIERLTNLLDGIVGLTRLELRQVSPSVELDLSTICKNIVNNYTLTHSDKKFRKKIVGKLRLKAPLENIYAIVENLLQNAVKYTPSGGFITVTLFRDSRRILLGVRDTGCGIDPDEQLQIFQPFWRGRATDGIPGSGLGLAIATEAARNLGGSITVFSEKNHGSLFTVELPLTRSEKFS